MRRSTEKPSKWKPSGSVDNLAQRGPQAKSRSLTPQKARGFGMTASWKHRKSTEPSHLINRERVHARHSSGASAKKPADAENPNATVPDPFYVVEQGPP